jgi:hypothetical protein
MSGKISGDATVPFKSSIFVPGIDLSLPLGSQNVKLLASSLAASQFATPQGAAGNGTTDDTAALQAAINAGIANQTPVYIPAGRYLISAPLTVDRGVHIFGAYVEPQTQLFMGTPNPGGNGTWIVLDGTHLVSAFVINPTGTPSANNQAMGIEIDHLGIIHNQPAPAASWAPRAYPPAIDVPAGSDVYLHDIFLMNPTSGIRAAGQSAGRLIIERISGQPLSTGIILDNQTDTTVVRDVHFWVNWSLDTNVLAYMKASGTGILLGRIDNPVIDNFVCLWMWTGCEIVATTNGSAHNVRLTNCDLDECANPFVINDSTGGHTVYMTGCLLAGLGDTTTPGSAVSILGSGQSSQVFLSACTLGTIGDHCVVNSATGGSNHVRMAACQLWHWDGRNTGAYCLQSTGTNTIRVDAATLSYSVNSNANLAQGPGQCVKAPLVQALKGTMGSAATSVVVPHTLAAVPDTIVVTPEGGPSSATEWWGTADASNVTVHVNVAPGSSIAFGVIVGLVF